MFDETVRSILSKILNVNLAQESAWMQASLPVRAGVGVRRAVQLAPSAYLVSAAGCSELMRENLPSHLQNTTDPSSEVALACWCQGHSESPPSAPDSFHQKAWDLVQIETTFDSLLETAPNQQARARLLAVSTSESGAWLHALPISALGLRMDDDVIRIAVGLRLGLPLCRPHCCSNCASAVDNLGTHGLSCRFSKGRHSRHAALNDIIKRSLESAKVPCHLEPTGLYRSDGKRPDGASVVPWRGGKVLVWDATCAGTLAPSHISLAVRESGAVAADAELQKKQKYLLLDSTHHFVPVAVETLGPIGRGTSFSEGGGTSNNSFHPGTTCPSVFTAEGGCSCSAGEHCFSFRFFVIANFILFYLFYFILFCYCIYCCSHACLFIFSLNVLYCFYFINFIYLFL